MYRYINLGFSSQKVISSLDVRFLGVSSIARFFQVQASMVQSAREICNCANFDCSPFETSNTQKTYIHPFLQSQNWQHKCWSTKHLSSYHHELWSGFASCFFKNIFQISSNAVAGNQLSNPGGRWVIPVNLSFKVHFDVALPPGQGNTQGLPSISNRLVDW